MCIATKEKGKGKPYNQVSQFGKINPRHCERGSLATRFIRHILNNVTSENKEIEMAKPFKIRYAQAFKMFQAERRLQL